MAWGNRIELERLQMCEACGYAACVCAFKKAHALTCQRRRAVLDTHPEPCAAHGTYACELCNPCTCAATGDTPGKVIELFDALKGALGKTGSR